MQGVPEEIDRLEHGQVGVKPETWAYLAEVLPEPENDLAIEELRNSIATAISRLSPRDKFIIEASFYERISRRELAERLGYSRSGTQRLVDRAKQNLKDALMTSKSVRDAIGAENTWNLAAREALLDLAPTGVWSTEVEPLQALDYHVELARREVRDDVHDGVILWDLEQAAMTAAVLLDEQEAWDVHEMEELLVGKQADYGCNNILSFGMQGIVVRVSDKQARLANILSKGATPKNESLIDTLKDIVGYAVVARMLVEGTFVLPLEGDIEALRADLLDAVRQAKEGE